MSDNPSNDSTTDVEPPFVELTPPNVSDLKITWLVIAKNRRVNREWEALMERYPENCCRCYQDLWKLLTDGTNEDRQSTPGEPKTKDDF